MYSSSSASYNALYSVLATYSIVILIIAILTIVANWKVFEKAGKPGWASLIPVYNMVVLYQIVGLNPWLLLLYFVPIVNYIASIVLTVMQCSRLAKAFGKGTGYAVGLFFLNTIFMLMLSFSDAKYKGIPE